MIRGMWQIIAFVTCCHGDPHVGAVNVVCKKILVGKSKAYVFLRAGNVEIWTSGLAEKKHGHSSK